MRGGSTAGLAREGEYWTVVHGDREFRVRDSKGIGYLAQLLAHPGHGIAALALYSGMTVTAAADAGPQLDEPAKRAYRRRVEELREEIDQAEAFHDPERLARARVEHETIVDELAAATALGGRDRRAGSPSERARLNVSRAIRSAIARIARHDPVLGAHLTAGVQTGRTCVYAPDASAPLAWTVSTGELRRLDVGTAAPPQTRYAHNGAVNIGYQVVGEGPPDLVFVPGFLSHIDMQWTFPTTADFFHRLAGFSRLILYDKRDQGVSDRPAGVPTLEEDMDDLRAALDAVGSERAVLFGYSEGGPMSLLFAATHPERVRGLILNASFASGPRWLAHSDELGHRIRERVLDMLEHWGEGRGLELFAPSVTAPDQMRRFGVFERAVGSPAAMGARWATCSRMDVTPVLGAIRVPTLVLHRAGDRTAPAALAREIAQAIPHARYMEVPGIDHIPWIGDTAPILREVEAFVTDAGAAEAADRVLATVAFVRADDPAAARRLVTHHGGRVMRDGADDVLATFDGPALAIRCAREIVRRTHARAGIHTGECALTENAVSGVAVDIAARILALAGAGEVLVSSTVRDLVVGSGLRFADRGVHDLAGVPGEWRVFAVT